MDDGDKGFFCLFVCSSNESLKFNELEKIFLVLTEHEQVRVETENYTQSVMRFTRYTTITLFPFELNSLLHQ